MSFAARTVVTHPARALLTQTRRMATGSVGKVAPKSASLDARASSHVSALSLRGIHTSRPLFHNHHGHQPRPRTLNDLEKAVTEQLRTELDPVFHVDVVDRYGDGKMLEVTVGSPVLDGKPMVRQHRIVYKAIAPFADRYHALQVKVMKADGSVA